MAARYHPRVHFADPVFPDLRGDEAQPTVFRSASSVSVSCSMFQGPSIRIVATVRPSSLELLLLLGRPLSPLTSHRSSCLAAR